VDLSCEDYGRLHRLAANDQGPRVRIQGDARDLGTVPMFSVIAELRGTELPDEYVVLSAHLDSWHAGTGATDNGTGTVMMMEAMRILRAAYPNPRRTILVGHWGGEEQGLIGSRAFAEDHPEVLEGMQALFNQDNGTWRVEYLEGQGYLHAGEHIARWISRVPLEIGSHVELEFPGRQLNPGSDHSAFICHGVPAFRLQSHYDEYRQYTWHTNRDTFDKIVVDDLMNNATLAAMLAYMASEDPAGCPATRRSSRSIRRPGSRGSGRRAHRRGGATRRHGCREAGFFDRPGRRLIGSEGKRRGFAGTRSRGERRGSAGGGGARVSPAPGPHPRRFTRARRDPPAPPGNRRIPRPTESRRTPDSSRPDRSAPPHPRVPAPPDGSRGTPS
jgi:carboxypeptidase Q